LRDILKVSDKDYASQIYAILQYMDCNRYFDIINYLFSIQANRHDNRAIGLPLPLYETDGA